MKILVAGGAGYIGAHTCVVLAELGYDLVVIDSLVNSSLDNVRRLRQISPGPIEFIEADLRDRDLLEQVFSRHSIDAVINFAGFKAVGESVTMPLDYYDNNLDCAVSLLTTMCRHDVRFMVFSSSAAVYAESASLPIVESAAIGPCSPYGKTKFFIEEMLRDLARADSAWKIAILRYFNPVGAHPSGLIGEAPSGLPNNLMPLIGKVAAGELDKLQIFGNDYDTPDGTAIRDYIHVMDLARGHGNALQALGAREAGRVLTLNLGTGRGYSVLEMVKAYEAACGHELAIEFVGRRAGDLACSFADSGLAKTELGWRAELDIDDMCRDAWNWQQRLSAGKD